MTVHNADKIIERVAEDNNTTVEEVRAEMTRAILEGFSNPAIKEKWNRLFGEGVIPSPEQFICTLAEKVKSIAV